MTDMHFHPPDAVDPLGDVLHMLKLNGTLYCRATLGAPWGVALPQMDRSMLFIVIMAPAMIKVFGGPVATTVGGG